MNEVEELRDRIEKIELRIDKLFRLFKKLQNFVHKEVGDKYKRIGSLRVSKTQITAIVISLSLSLTNFFLRWKDTRPTLVWKGIRSINMNEIFSVIDFNKWIRPNFVFIVPVLIGVGLFLKYILPKLNNKLIPVILFGVGFVLASGFGYFNSQYLGGARIYDTFIIAGLSQGFVTTASAVATYSMVHGSKRVFNEWRGKSKGVEK